MKEKLAILIPAHDSHKDIVNVFEGSMKKYYPDCQYKIFWTNCGCIVDSSIIQGIFNAEDAGFCQRIKHALTEINAEYIWLWVEDFIPIKKISNQEINKILSYMSEHNCNYCRMFQANKRFMKKDEENDGIYKINNNMPYGISINSGIFKKDFLENLILDEAWNVWQLEGYCLELASKKLLCKCIYASNNVGNITHLLFKGKIFRGAANKIKRAGINLDLSREILPIRDSLHVIFFSVIGHNCPIWLRKKLKSLAKRVGFMVASKY